jgi:glutamate-1-semialdehyde 2,1-aminomutase
VFLKDVDENEYLDYCMSWGPLIFGHADAEIQKAVQEALPRGWSYGTVEPYSLALAECVTQAIPWVEKIRFVSSGTEAVMSALRLARAVTGRTLVVKFDGCYHGHVDSLLVRAGSALADMALPDSAGISKKVAEETAVLKLGDVPGLEAFFEENGKQVACVIVEPLPANYGLLIQEASFLKKLAKITQEAGSLLIFDEVISGFRVGFQGMAGLTGIKPDLVTFGKILGGGFPVGAYGGASRWMDAVAPSGPMYQAGTLSAQPLAMVAGLATLQKLQQENPYALLEARTQALAQALREVAREEGIALEVKHFASLFWIVFGNQGQIQSPQQIPEEHRTFFPRLFHALLEQGIYLAPSAFEVSFLSTLHTDETSEILIQAMRIALQVFKTA